MAADRPSPDALRLDVAALNDFLGRAFPFSAPGERGSVVEAAPGRIVSTLPCDERRLRPGGVVSGPTLMALADQAAYALVLAHVGEVAMAVTTSLTIHFLRGCAPGLLHAEARLVKLGRRIVTVDVRLWTQDAAAPAAQALVAYALPEATG